MSIFHKINLSDFEVKKLFANATSSQGGFFIFDSLITNFIYFLCK
jgi:hypothetical protein